MSRVDCRANILNRSPRCPTRGKCLFAAMLLVLVASQSQAAPIFLTPTPYLAFDNTLPGAGTAVSPFAGLSFSYFHLETFEDNMLDTPGASAVGGSVTGPGGITDSVDADDGAIDGSGLNGRSMFGSGASGIRFDFSAAALGQLPTHVGIVWTDGATLNNVTLEAFDATGVSSGTITELNVGDGSFDSGTSEDRFFGVIDTGGISAIRITSPAAPGAGGSGIEVDHLQYGLLVPLPGDGNGDGWVDGLDYLLWASHFGDNPAEDPPGFPANGDYNNDGLVDGLDYLVWASNYGQGPNDATTVPEPGNVGLVVIAIVALAGWRKPSRRRRALRP